MAERAAAEGGWSGSGYRERSWSRYGGGEDKMHKLPAVWYVCGRAQGWRPAETNVRQAGGLGPVSAESSKPNGLNWEAARVSQRTSA